MSYLATVILVVPFLSFAIGIFIPSKVERGAIKQSFLIGVIGSAILILLANSVGPLMGDAFDLSPNYTEMIDEIGLTEVISLSIWGIVSSTFTSLLGTLFSPFKQDVEKTQPSYPTIGDETHLDQGKVDREKVQTDTIPMDEKEVHCVECRNRLRWIDKYKMWYCDYCMEYKSIEIETHEEEEEKEVTLCPSCMLELRWIPQYQEWYCDHCGRYVEEVEKTVSDVSEIEEETDMDEFEEEEEEITEPCPDCDGEVRWLAEYNRWYCDNCKEYKSMDDKDKEEVSHSIYFCLEGLHSKGTRLNHLLLSGSRTRDTR